MIDCGVVRTGYTWLVCLKKIETVLWSFEKIWNKSGGSWRYILQVWKSLLRNTLYFGLHKTEKIADLRIVNSTHFQNPQNCKNLSFLCNPEYNEICIETLHACRTRTYLQPDFFLKYFDSLILPFSIFLKRAMCSLSSNVSFPHLFS
jgi:hypothetical protein